MFCTSTCLYVCTSKYQAPGQESGSGNLNYAELRSSDARGKERTESCLLFIGFPSAAVPSYPSSNPDPVMGNLDVA